MRFQVSLMEYDENRYKGAAGGGRNAYDEDDSDEEMAEGGGHPGMRCAQS